MRFHFHYTCVASLDSLDPLMRIQRTFSFEVAMSLSVFIFGSHFKILVDFILSPGLVGNSVLITIGKFGKEPKGTEIDNLKMNTHCISYKRNKLI